MPADATGAERNREGLGHAAAERGRGGADVAAGGERHADVAGEARGEAAEDEGDGAPQAGLHERQGLLAVRLVDGRAT
jgi:hypothetical protein